MRSALHAPPPSSTLLKFLKSQSEAICFFSHNPRHGFVFDHAAPRASQLRSSPISRVSKTPTRCLSSAIARTSTVEAGFLNLDFLWPRSATSIFRPSSAQCRNVTRNRESQYSRALLAQRKASSGSRKWLSKLWGMKPAKGGKGLQPDDLPSSLHGRGDSGDTSVFSLGRAVSAKAAAQPKIRCTELDENGNVVLASGEFKKSELIAKVRFLLL